MGRTTGREEFTRHGQTWDIWFPEKKDQMPEVSKQLAVGDEVWYVCGCTEGLLSVKCKIDEVEDSFRKEYKEAYLFYWLDEPVGHAIDFDDVQLCREWARDDLLERYRDYGAGGKRHATLKNYRDQVEAFIKHTWEHNGEDMHPGFDPRPDKQEGVEWFNVEMALAEVAKKS